MEVKYDKDEMNSKISMGEVSLICDEKISDKNIMNKIITSTILKLHLKNYIKFNKNEKGKIIIQIQDSKVELKKTEKLILECLKASDIEKDNELQLEEITRTNNQIFYKNKRKLKNLIIEESIEDEYIDKEKLELKQKHFSRITLTFLLIALFVSLTLGFENLIRISS